MSNSHFHQLISLLSSWWSIRPLYDLSMKMRSLIGEDVPRREAVNILDIQPGQRVLHLGCGLGACLPLLKERGADVVAVDSCRCRVDASRQAVRNGRWHNIRVMQINTAMLPFADGSFDAIISTGGFTRSDNFRLMIHESGRLLKANGKMAVIEFMPPENAGVLCSGLARLYYVLSHTDPYCAWRQELNNIIVPLEEHRVWHGLGKFVYGCKNRKYVPIPDMIKALNEKANQAPPAPPAKPAAPAQQAKAASAPAPQAKAKPAQPATPATQAKAAAAPAPQPKAEDKPSAIVKATPAQPVKAAPKAMVVAGSAKPAPEQPAAPAPQAKPAPEQPAAPAPQAKQEPAPAALAPQAKQEPAPAAPAPQAKQEPAPAAPAPQAKQEPAQPAAPALQAKQEPAPHHIFETPTTEPTVDAIRRHEVPVPEPEPAPKKESANRPSAASDKLSADPQTINIPKTTEPRKKHVEPEPLSTKTKTSKNNIVFADLVSKYESDMYAQENKAEDIPLKIDAPQAPHIPQQPKAQSEGLLSHLFGKKTIESSLPRNLLSGNAQEDKEVRNVLRHPTPKAVAPAKMTMKDKTGSRSLLRSWQDKKTEPQPEAPPQTPPQNTEDSNQKMMMIPAPKRKRKKN